MKKIAITIKPTNDCNMRCKHCYHAEEGFCDLKMNPMHAKRIIDIAIKEYDQIKIVFHGGEPTLWGKDNIREILEYEKVISSKNPKISFINSIQTNGVLLDNEWIDMFSQYPITVGVSFDGPHNDVLRSNTAVVYQNLIKLRDSGVKYGVICVESQKTIGSLKHTYSWFKQENIDFKILALFMSGNAINDSALELNINEYVQNLTGVYQDWLFDKNCHIRMFTFEDLLKVADKLYCLQYGGSCIYKRIALNPNGDIYPCGRPYTEDFKLGNVNEAELISDIFMTDAYQHIVRISQQRTTQCKKKCKYFGVCRGGCVSSAILEGSFEKIDNVSCVRARTLLEKVSKINERIYAQYDNEENIDIINPRALEIMQKVRNGEYEFTHFSRE